MNSNLLNNQEVRRFIIENEDGDINALALKKGTFKGVPYPELASQIISKKKAKNKIPNWYLTEGIIYPLTRSVEQASSEILARFKFESFHGDVAVDLTGGMGVDSWILSQRFRKLIYVEKEEYLTTLATNNFKALGVENVEIYNQTAEEFLENNLNKRNKFDLIYVDPSRRRSDNSRVFLFSDCYPNIQELSKQLLSNADIVMVKASPLIDISYGIEELDQVSDVHVISHKSDVKEVLFYMKDLFEGETTISAFELHTEENFDALSFSFSEEDQVEVEYGTAQVGEYLYIPNKPLLKAGAFKTIAKYWNLKKLHQSTHIYSSEVLKPEFQGRVLRIKRLFQSLNQAAKSLKGRYLNVISKNFKLNAPQIQKKLGSIDGGHDYLVCGKSIEGTKIYLAELISP